MVEDGYVDPREVGAEAGGPHHRADLSRAQGEPQGRLAHAGGFGAFPATPGLGRRSCRADARASGRPGRRRWPASPRTARRPSRTPANRPTRRTPEAWRALRSSAARRADELQRRQVTGPDDVVHLVPPLVEDAERVEPPEDVAAPVGPRHPHVLADRERNASAGALELVGDLHPARGRAHDEHAARRAPGRGCGTRSAGIETHVRQAPGDGRDDARVVARRQDHGARVPAARSVSTSNPSPPGRTAVTVVPVTTGAADAAAYPAMKSATSGADRYPSGSSPWYVQPGSRRHPVGGEQPERVPALGSPRVATSPRSRTTWSIERSVRWRLIASPAVPGPDHDCGDASCIRPR